MWKRLVLGIGLIFLTYTLYFCNNKLHNPSAKESRSDPQLLFSKDITINLHNSFRESSNLTHVLTDGKQIILLGTRCWYDEKAREHLGVLVIIVKQDGEKTVKLIEGYTFGRRAFATIGNVLLMELRKVEKIHQTKICGFSLNDFRFIWEYSLEYPSEGFPIPWVVFENGIAVPSREGIEFIEVLSGKSIFVIPWRKIMPDVNERDKLYIAGVRDMHSMNEKKLIVFVLSRIRESPRLRKTYMICVDNFHNRLLWHKEINALALRVDRHSIYSIEPSYLRKINILTGQTVITRELKVAGDFLVAQDEKHIFVYTKSDNSIHCFNKRDLSDAWSSNLNIFGDRIPSIENILPISDLMLVVSYNAYGKNAKKELTGLVSVGCESGKILFKVTLKGNYTLNHESPNPILLADNRIAWITVDGKDTYHIRLLNYKRTHLGEQNRTISGRFWTSYEAGRSPYVLKNKY